MRIRQRRLPAPATAAIMLFRAPDAVPAEGASAVGDNPRMVLVGAGEGIIFRIGKLPGNGRGQGSHSAARTDAGTSIMHLAVVCLAALAAVGCASTRAPGIDPASAQIQPSGKHYQAARAALMRGDTAKANVEVKLALQDDPLDAKSHYLFGCLLEMKGEHDQAVVGFQRAVAFDSTNPEALYNLGTLLLRRGQAVPAAPLLENAVLIRPDHVPSWNNLAKAYYQAGLPELTVAAYEESLCRDPSNAIALKNLVLLADAAGLQDTAATYRRRLGTLQSGGAEKPATGAENPVAPPPTWPVAATGAGSSVPTSLPAIPAPEQGIRDDTEANDLRELLHDLPHVTVERRGGRLTLTGWTSSKQERSMLDRILGKLPEGQDKRPAARPSETLDLTTDDIGDPQRMIEIDAVLFITTMQDVRSEGFNFLKAVNLNFNYFAADHKRDGTGYSAPPELTGAVQGLSQWGWIFGASVDYVVNIANASDDRVAVLARPHLTTVSGTPAKFLAGGELVYKVTGINSGDIRPYPFGTTLTVTPTLLRTLAQDGAPRVRMVVEAGRLSVLSLLDAANANPNIPTAFTKVNVTSEAVVSLGQTLILSGLSQRESHSGKDGVPILMDIPIVRFSHLCSR